jgi:organic radical activating enzyme
LIDLDEKKQLLDSGKALPVMEEFYSLQGEGFHTGKAAYFIRIGGCDVGCHWCDVKESWDADLHPVVLVDDVVGRAAQQTAKAVVLTGGEPAIYNLGELCKGLKNNGIKIFLETSGAYPLTGEFDWVCLSPKRNSPPVDNVLQVADELKVIIEQDEDFKWAENYAALVKEQCLLFLQPEWSRHKEMMPRIVDYVMENPKWQISLQSHKYMKIP